MAGEIRADLTIDPKTDRAEQRLDRIRARLEGIQKQMGSLEKPLRLGLGLGERARRTSIVGAIGQIPVEERTASQKEYLKLDERLTAVKADQAGAIRDIARAEKEVAAASAKRAVRAAEQIKKDKQMTTSILRLTAMLSMFKKWQNTIQKATFGSAKVFAETTLRANKYSDALRKVNEESDATAKATELITQTRILELNAIAIKAAFGEIVAGPVSQLYTGINQVGVVFTNMLQTLPEGVGTFIVLGTVILSVILAVLTLWISLKRISILLSEITKKWLGVEVTGVTALQKTQMMVTTVAMSLGAIIAFLTFILLLFTDLEKSDPFSGLKTALSASEDLKKNLMGFDKLNILQEEQDVTMPNYDVIFEGIDSMNDGLQRMYDIMVLIAALGFAVTVLGISKAIAVMAGASSTLALTIGLVAAGIALFLGGIVSLIANWGKMTTGAKVAAIAIGAIAAAIAVVMVLLGNYFAAAAALAVGGAMMIGISQLAHKADTSIPAAAAGGVTTGPTVALVGEGRYEEAIVPLGNSPQFATMKADIAQAIIDANGTRQGGDINLYSRLEIGGRELDTYIERVADNYIQRQTGRPVRDLGRRV